MLPIQPIKVLKVRVILSFRVNTAVYPQRLGDTSDTLMTDVKIREKSQGTLK